MGWGVGINASIHRIINVQTAIHVDGKSQQIKFHKETKFHVISGEQYINDTSVKHANLITPHLL